MPPSIAIQLAESGAQPLPADLAAFEPFLFGKDGPEQDSGHASVVAASNPPPPPPLPFTGSNTLKRAPPGFEPPRNTVSRSTMPTMKTLYLCSRAESVQSLLMTEEQEGKEGIERPPPPSPPPPPPPPTPPHLTSDPSLHVERTALEPLERLKPQRRLQPPQTFAATVMVQGTAPLAETPASARSSRRSDLACVLAIPSHLLQSVRAPSPVYRGCPPCGYVGSRAFFVSLAILYWHGRRVSAICFIHSSLFTNTDHHADQQCPMLSHNYARTHLRRRAGCRCGLGQYCLL